MSISYNPVIRIKGEFRKIWEICLHYRLPKEILIGWSWLHTQEFRKDVRSVPLHGNHYNIRPEVCIAVFSRAPTKTQNSQQANSEEYQKKGSTTALTGGAVFCADPVNARCKAF
jgi:hypothetical protein